MGAKLPQDEDETNKKKMTPIKRQKLTKAKNAVSRCVVLEDILRITYQTMRASLQETETEISDAEQLLKNLTRRLEQREEQIQDIITENCLHKRPHQQTAETTNKMEEVEVAE